MLLQKLLQPFHRWRLALLLLTALSSPGVQAEENDAIKGTLVIIGGALRNDNREVWSRIVDAAGGRHARIAVIPAASGDPEAAGKKAAVRLQAYGADAFVVPLSIRSKTHRAQDIASSKYWAEQIRRANGVYFTGGDQGRITAALRTTDGGNSPMLDAIWQIYRRGGVIAGSSAGAAIMSTTMFFDAMPTFDMLKNGVQKGKEISAGLGFIGPGVFIDQHLIIRGRFARMIPAMQQAGYTLGLGIDENTALVVREREHVEIVGYKGAILIDLSTATSDSTRREFNISRVRLSYLDSGDRFNLSTGQLTPAADKLQHPLDPDKPYFHGARFYPDILGNTTLTDLMFELIDSDQHEAIGLAFDHSKLREQGNGFEFRFYKTPDSIGYFSSTNGHESYSISRLALDIRPVQMNAPLYQ
ncbi:cyanophycinase [Burkholderiaceae bacterium DAT-1]|nr:cyanophycinase [Burkholderiaceae bacterium DAT-1]